MKYTFLHSCTIFFGTLSAQTAEDQSTIAGVQTGFSLASALFNLSEIDANVDASTPPAVQLTYDYALTDRLSLGEGFLTRISSSPIPAAETPRRASTFGCLFNLGIRALFHYGNSRNHGYVLQACGYR